MNEIVITIGKADNGWVVTGNGHIKVAREGIYELESVIMEIIRDFQESMIDASIQEKP